MLKATLVQCARATIKNKKKRFSGQYERIKQRRGDKRAIMAVARTLLVIIYNMIKDGSKYEELGREYLQNIKKQEEKLGQ